MRLFLWGDILGVSYITTNLYCICVSARFMFFLADAVQICGNIRSTRYESGLLLLTYLELYPWRVGHSSRGCQMVEFPLSALHTEQ